MADQRLVSHLDLFICFRVQPMGDNESCVGQHLYQFSERIGIPAGRNQIPHGDALPCIAALSLRTSFITQTSQPDEDPLHPLLILRGQVYVDFLCRTCNRFPDAAQRTVFLREQPAAVPARPQLTQEVLQQRHRARLALHLVQDRIRQIRFEVQPDRRRLFLHRAA